MLLTNFSQLLDRVNRTDDIHHFDTVRYFMDNKTFAPPADITVNETGYHITVDMPGFKASDISVNIEKDHLVVRGKRESHEEHTEKDAPANSKWYQRIERFQGNEVARSFLLSEDVDSENIKAELQDGVLSIVVGRVSNEKPQRTVEVVAIH